MNRTHLLNVIDLARLKMPAYGVQCKPVNRACSSKKPRCKRWLNWRFFGFSERNDPGRTIRPKPAFSTALSMVVFLFLSTNLMGALATPMPNVSEENKRAHPDSTPSIPKADHATPLPNPDDTQLIYIHSHQAFLNHPLRQLTYKGHVRATQGSRKLSAQQVIISQNKTGAVERVVAQGEPAKYQYKPIESNTLTHINANTIRYQPAKKQFTFIDNVWFNHDGNTFQGDYGTYNTLTEDIKSQAVDHQNNQLILQPFDKD